MSPAMRCNSAQLERLDENGGNMDLLTLIAACTGLVLGALIAFLYMKAKNSELQKDLAAKLAACEKEIETLTTKGVSVVTYPYKEVHGEDGYFSDDRRAEIGYKFQLFVAGIPCFEPHKTTVEVLSKKEVNGQRISQAIEHVFSLIQTFALKHPAFVALQSAPKSDAGGT